MLNFRNVIIFLAGAEFFHTLSHIFYYYFAPLPLDLKIIVLTPTLNIWGIVINAVITIALLWWAIKLKTRANHNILK